MEGETVKAVASSGAVRWLRFAGLLLTLLLVHIASAQDVSAPRHKQSQWQAYSGDYQVSGRWGIHFDGGWREMTASGWQQWLVRPGVNLALAPRTRLQVTYSHFKAHPAGIKWDTKSLPEHRLHQQISYYSPLGRLRLEHRFRAEQRFFGPEFERKGLDSGWMQHRLRYLAGLRVPLQRPNQTCASCYARLYNEVMVRLRNAGVSRFEQNRVFAGLGFRPASHWGIESGVFYQRFVPQLGADREHNLVLYTTVSTQLDLRAMFRR